MPARSITRSTRDSSPSRSSTSSIMPKTRHDLRRSDLRAGRSKNCADKLPTLKKYVVLTDKAHMPQTALPNAVAYEDWLAGVDGDFQMGGGRGERRSWHVLHLRHHRQSEGRRLFASLERAARDGGVAARRDRLVSRDIVLPVVPLFHANSWSLAFSAPMTARVCHAGREARRRLDLRAAQRNEVSVTAAVPTVWLMLCNIWRPTSSSCLISSAC
jgi:fatty-acyl-CoA synthase